MVASNKTRRVMCTIVRVAETPALELDAKRFVRKPSTLVPWADPYIAGLVRRLQSEVRMERAAQAQHGERPAGVELFDNRGAAAWLASSAVADLDPPSPLSDEDWDWCDAPRWTVEGESAE